MIKKLFMLCMVLALVSPVLAATSDDMRDPISWLLSLGKGKSGGSQGPQGDPGPAGPQGTVLYVDCGENQCIMNQTPNQTAGPPGPQGIQGPQGIPGEPADILVNFTETVEPGENAYVVDVGEPGLAKLDFKIPRGYNGTPGTQGIQGPPGEQGEVGPEGPMGPANMTAGPQGPQGDPGTAATIDVNYTFTGAPGTSALVTNIGTTSAALLDFIIPSGNTQQLTFPVKACAGGTIYKGQAVYISGAVGNNPIVCQADNTNTAKSRVVGLMVADTAANGLGEVRRAGTLTPVDTRSSNTVINPLGQTWSAGDLLFATTGGGLTNVRPTSGRSVQVAYNLEAAGVNGALLSYPLENPVWVTAASAEDIVLRMGDSAGTNKVSFRNYSNAEIAFIKSDGTTSLNYNASYPAMVGGLVPTANLGSGVADNTKYLRGDQTWQTPSSNIEAAYPVGSIYLSTVSTNPNTLFGFGTWAAFGTGRMPIGIDAGNTQFDVAEETGGSNVSSAVVTHTHTATVTDEGHNHLQTKNSATTGAVTGYGVDASTSTQINSGYYTASNTTGISVTNANPAGSVSSFSIMNPYIVVYMWERTA
jgi:hypothetical protein